MESFSMNFSILEIYIKNLIFIKNSQRVVAMHTVGGGEKGSRGRDACPARVGVVHSQGGGVGRVVGPRLLAAKNPAACLGHAHQGQADHSQNQIFLLHL